MLLIGMSEDLPYSYYQCLRWVVCLVSVALFFIQYNHKSIDATNCLFLSPMAGYALFIVDLVLLPYLFLDGGVLVVLFFNFCTLIFLIILYRDGKLRGALILCWLIIAVIFNPFIPFQAEESEWKIIDFVTGLCFIVSYAWNDLYCRKLLITSLSKKKLKYAQVQFNSYRSKAELSSAEIHNLTYYIDNVCYLAYLYQLPGTFYAMARGWCTNEQDVGGNSKEFIKSLEKIAEIINSDSTFVEPRLAKNNREDYQSKCTEVMYLLGYIYEHGYYLGWNGFRIPLLRTENFPISDSYLKILEDEGVLKLIFSKARKKTLAYLKILEDEWLSKPLTEMIVFGHLPSDFEYLKSEVRHEFALSNEGSLGSLIKNLGCFDDAMDCDTRGNLEYSLNYRFQVGRIDKNPDKAYEWYKKAAELGHLQSMLRLAAMHTDGEGDLKDLKQAKYWIKQASTFIEAQKAKINKAREYYFSSSSQEANNVIPTQSSSNSTPLGESNPEVLSQNFTQYLSPPTKGLLNSSKTNLVSCDGEKAVFQIPEKFKFLKAKLEAKSEEIVEALKVSGSSNLKYITIELIPNSATTLEAKVVKPEGD